MTCKDDSDFPADGPALLWVDAAIMVGAFLFAAALGAVVSICAWKVIVG